MIRTKFPFIIDLSISDLMSGDWPVTTEPRPLIVIGITDVGITDDYCKYNAMFYESDDWHSINIPIDFISDRHYLTLPKWYIASYATKLTIVAGPYKVKDDISAKVKRLLRRIKIVK